MKFSLVNQTNVDVISSLQTASSEEISEQFDAIVEHEVTQLQ